MPDGCEVVDLLKVMASAFSMSQDAALCMVNHGQVYIDGHCIQPRWVRHWNERQLYGRMLKCPRGEYRLIGSRLVKDYDQMRLA